MKTFRLGALGVLLGLFAAACVPIANEVSLLTPESNSTLESEEINPLPTENPSPQDSPPPNAQLEFSTDFSIHSVPYSEILSGGPPKDGIPAIDQPNFVSIPEANEWLKSMEPVILVEINKEAKAYPLQILTWHEIVNDSLGGVPIIVSFCPLCNTAIVFRREVSNLVLDFGTTGRLRYSNLIMYDRQTETWWQQAEGVGIAGKLTGTQLEPVPAAIISWEEYKSGYPQGLVLSRETGFSRAYGQNPYTGYDDVNRPPFLYDGPTTPGKLAPVARVLALELNGDAVAYPYDLLKTQNVVNDQVGGSRVVIFWTADTASALDTAIIAEGRDVGAAIAYRSELDGIPLQFSFDGQNIIDEQTQSTWNVLGRAVDGELAGQQLDSVVSINHFWFSWAAFKPQTRIYEP